jgi:hypothetical protein
VNAQVKPDPYEQTAREIQLANRRSEVFEIDRAKAYEELLDELDTVLMRMLPAVLSNYKAGDDAENGRIIGECIGGYAIRVQRAREAEELRRDLLPSWRDA